MPQSYLINRHATDKKKIQSVGICSHMLSVYRLFPIKTLWSFSGEIQWCLFYWLAGFEHVQNFLTDTMNKSIFECKNVNIFLPISFNIYYGCSKEPSH